MAHTAQEYADAHRHVMQSLNNLHIIQFDVVVPKGTRSLLYCPRTLYTCMPM